MGCLLAVVVVLLTALRADAQPTGSLTQLAGTAGCTSETGSGGACADGKGLDGAAAVAVSADGKSAYVASLDSSAVTAYQRNSTTGALTQLAGTAGCVSETGSGGACANGKALVGAASVAVSADGMSVYVASHTSNAVAVFARNTTTGQLTQLAGLAGCVSETGSGGACADGKALLGAFSVAVSADGKSVYVAAASGDAVAAFQRNTTTGQLTQLAGAAGCVSETGSGGACADGRALAGPISVATSADGRSVYVASVDSDAVPAFARNTTTGQLTQLPGAAGCVSETGSDPADPTTVCADGKALDDVSSLALSRDGRSVYVTSFPSDGPGVAAFQRNTTTGQLTQLAGTAGCVSHGGSGGACAAGRALQGPWSVAVSADGSSVYVASFLTDGIAVFRRNTTTGQLTQLAGTNGCVLEGLSGGQCADGRGLLGARSVAVSADARNVYVASSDSDAVATFRRRINGGNLIQLPGTQGCVSETGSGGICADGKALDFASAVAVSGDGMNAYVISANAVAVFRRSTTTGRLIQLAGTAGCMSETGSGGICTNGKALNGATAVAVSADGENVYVASASSDAVAVFARNTTTGQLTQPAGTAGCMSETGSDPLQPATVCANGKALDGAYSVRPSADGKSVYVASIIANAVAALSRNTTTGALTQPAGPAGCVSETGSGGACANGKALGAASSVALSPDGTSTYVSSFDAVAVFSRNTTTGQLTQLPGLAGCVSETGSGGQCADGKALGAESVVVSRDGKNVYTASAASEVAVFERNTTSGQLTQLPGTAGCLSEDGSGGQCADAKALAGARSVAGSRDGRNVYVASYNSDAVAVFARSTITGRLTQLAGTAGCVSETGSGGQCADGKALAGPWWVTVSPDSKNVYVAASTSDAVAVFRRELP